jgi:hypothetical protein
MVRASPSNSVFVNCPFDKSYEPLFKTIIFTTFDCGFLPRCALEIDDGTENRLTKISRMIEQCQFAIHDISYTDIDPATELPRFNMPFELGLYFGCQRFGAQIHRKKTSLILDRGTFRYRQFLSDIAGHDVHAHDSEPRKAVREVRDWLRAKSGVRNIPGGTEIWNRYERFMRQLPLMCCEATISIEELTFAVFANFVAAWLETTR